MSDLGFAARPLAFATTLALLAGSAALGGCAAHSSQRTSPTPPGDADTAVFTEVAFDSVDGWLEDSVDQVAPAIDRQCALTSPPAPWPALCASYAARGSLHLREWIHREFRPWRVAARSADGILHTEGLVTGYYEALLTGSRVQSPTFNTPLYGVPQDLLTVALGEVAPSTAHLRLRGRIEGRRIVPYHDRRAIADNRVLAGQELLWVSDPVDAFFLQIQGSGRVRLPDGSMVAVRYADQNGHPYRAIGRYLIDQGLLTREQADAAGIKSWLREHPERASDIMAWNPSYVFFTEQATAADAATGPPGSLGVPLTPLRSVAVDNRFIPAGALVFVATPHPEKAGPLETLAVAQDTGGAIRGPVRADVFWGLGADAEAAAGRMRSSGRLWVLWPRSMPPPGAARQ